VVSEPLFLWPPIKRYSRSFFGVPSSSHPTPADHVANAAFLLFLRRSFQWPPIFGRLRRQFLRQLLPKPIALPSKPLLAKRTTKSGVSALDRWICAISAHSGVANAPCSSPNDRSNAPSPDPKRSPQSKLPRASRAAMVWHAPLRADCISHVLPCTLAPSGT
jgi:hypothetical protein